MGKKLTKHKKNLLDKKNDLLRRITAAKESGESSGEVVHGDYIDQANFTQDREITYVLGDRDRQELKAIEAALVRIEEGTYGVCERCSEEIDSRRLEVLPYARFCRNCQTKMEVRSSQRR